MNEKENNASRNKETSPSHRVVLIQRAGKEYLEKQEEALCAATAKKTLKHGPVLLINPPPEDGCCSICGKSWRDLKPFGGPGDPLAGDFSGALLVKKFRPGAPPLSEKEMERFKRKYGEEKASLYAQFQSQVGPSWECRDCIVLSHKRALINQKIALERQASDEHRSK